MPKLSQIDQAIANLESDRAYLERESAILERMINKLKGIQSLTAKPKAAKKLKPAQPKEAA